MAKYCVGLLVLFTALLCITWCDALRCLPCDKAKCKILTLRDCPYGLEKDVCGCCNRCMKGESDTCGGSWNLAGTCGKPCICTGSTRNRPGVCLPSIRCFKTAKCSGKCKDPTGCKYGIGKNRCSCCRKCLKGPGEECGIQSFGRIPCGKGLRCVGEDIRSSGRCQYIKKTPPPSDGCFKKRNCRNVSCPQNPKHCKNGIGKSPCGCCRRCLVGPGASCGVKHEKFLPCGRGYRCIGERVRNGRYYPGTCEGKKINNPFGKCPRKLYCRFDIVQRPPRCKYGISRPICGCYFKCNKNSGEKCGYRVGNCRTGYFCKGIKQYRRTWSIKYVDGICSRKEPNPSTGNCYQKQNCRAIRCGRPRNCRYGIGKSPCGCCKRCLKGPGSKCGVRHSRYLPCGKGMLCQGETIKKGRYIPGRCVLTTVPVPGKCPERIACIEIFIPPPKNCKYGYSKPACGCFEACNKDAGDKCGFKTSSCRSGYYCEGQRYIRKGNKFQYIQGVCTRKGSNGSTPHGKCPRIIRCPKVRRAPPRECRYGFSRPLCRCGLVCNKDIDEKCGYTTGNCRSGYFCKGQTYIRRGPNIQYISGRCRKKETVRCFTTVRCKRGSCILPRYCKYGIGKNNCSCCPSCLRGPGESCGLRNAGRVPCGKNMRCVGETRRRKGRCIRNGGSAGTCPCSHPCPEVICRIPRYCRYGYAKSRCGCCAECKKSNGERCGARRGVCRSGFFCQGTHLSKDFRGRCIFKSGICRPRIVPAGKCPLPVPCTKIYRPPPTGCRYGYSRLICGCKRVCNKGSGEKCGYTTGNCRSGYSCRGQRYVWKGDKIKYISGRCIRKQNPSSPKCYRKTNCALVFCGNPPSTCRYGVGKSPCGCCRTCLKGPGEKCGIAHSFYLPCGRGLKCIGERWSKSYKPGVCRSTSLPQGRCPCVRRCSRIRCRKPRNCRYGYGKAICACCASCRRGKGEKCGDRIGVCRSGYYCRGKRTWKTFFGTGCRFKNGFCARRVSSGCKYPVICPLIQKPPPVGCKYGYSKPVCSCFAVCRRGLNERCGYNKADCRNGLTCYGRRIRKVNGRIFYTDGRCRSRRGCPYILRCSRRPCPRYRCRYGIAKPKCGCCPVCRRGRNERCGIRDGLCRRGYRCVGDRVRVVHGRPIFTAGRCVSRRGTCPYRIDCSRRQCPRYRCRYGIAKPKCGCCPVCRRGQNGKCGIRDGLCRHGYRCVGSRVRVVHGKPVFTPGRCISIRSSCRYPIACPRIYRPPPTGCEYGYSKPACACFYVCRRDINQRCGYNLADCRRGLTCYGRRIRKTNRGITYTDGRCRSRGGCPYFIRCSRRPCPRYRCRYGIAKPKCGCCPICRRDGNQWCGIKHGLCRSGYRCVGANVRVFDGKPVFTAGKCISVRNDRQVWPPTPPVVIPIPPVSGSHPHRFRPTRPFTPNVSRFHPRRHFTQIPYHHRPRPYHYRPFRFPSSQAYQRKPGRTSWNGFRPYFH